jgi:hypothetical protein
MRGSWGRPEVPPGPEGEEHTQNNGCHGIEDAKYEDSGSGALRHEVDFYAYPVERYPKGHIKEKR